MTGRDVEQQLSRCPGGGEGGRYRCPSRSRSGPTSARSAPWRGPSPTAVPTGWCCSIDSISPTSTWRRSALAMDLELSTPAEIRLSLLWIAILHGRVSASLAASTGVESADEVYKYLLAGADTVMTTSSLLRHGVNHMGGLLDGLVGLLAARGVCLGRGSPRSHESKELGGPNRVRAGELHSDSATLSIRADRVISALSLPRRRPILTG